MGRFLRCTIIPAVVATVGLLAIATPASAVTGTWTQYPIGASVYEATIQPPIDASGTSNWSSKSKGGIPVMFELAEGTGPAVFQSTASQPYSFIHFTPDQPFTIADLIELSATYDFTTGNCYGGSLRWQIETESGNVHVYFGEAPNWTNCDEGQTGDNNGDNMLESPDMRFDTSQVGGTFYDTYANAKALLGSDPITGLSFVVDSYWVADQILDPPTVTVNGLSYTWVSGGGTFAPTCDLPDATIEVTKTDPTEEGAINEATVQLSLADTGDAFRVVDCKYQYVLSIPSLQGTGTYQVDILIGSDVVGQAFFDLK